MQTTNNLQEDELFTLVTTLVKGYMIVLFLAIACLCLSSCPH